ncbi:bifunctional DNA primase/polymerase [Embleya sp. NPDC059213]|uniref:bifunctional DNA primase/polymerase n=1 Tax=Embleya sp. NPDC059213 TaxID=3346771 RepID=UPI0036747632
MSGREIAAAVLDYAEYEWKVFPILPGKVPFANCPDCTPERLAHSIAECPCLLADDGALCHGYHAATANPEVLRRWWGRYPAANIGLPCTPNGLAVVDVDPRNGGHRTLAALEQRHGCLPGTLMQITPGSLPDGGLHMIYRHPGVPLPGKLGMGIDVKANGYIVVAPSVHANGVRYRWSGHGETFRRPLAPWPRVLLPAPSPPAPRPVPTATGDRRTAVVGGLLRVVLEARPGERNERLFWAASRASGHCRAGLLDSRSAASALLDAALSIGLDEREARSTITSGFRTTGMSAA